MRKDFSLSNDKAMINFTVKYCDSMEKVLDSDGFKKVLNSYLKVVSHKETHIFKYIENSLPAKDINQITDNIINMFKMLTVMKIDTIAQIDSKYELLLSNKEDAINFIEDLYRYWRKLERYTIIQNNKINDGLESVSFIDANNDFSNRILKLYRKVEENILGYKPNVYRQLPAGGNAGLILRTVRPPYSEEYDAIKDIPFIDSVLLDPPFITYPKRNTRDGIFAEVFENPLKYASINKDHWFCFPVKVGELLAFIYFHRDFMAHGVTLCNLFEMAKEDEYRWKKPDIIYVYGARDSFDEVKTIFYDDVKNDVMLGYVSYDESIDYFGYMKKMTLTLHNLIMIKRGYLPIHGAMVNIVMKNGKSANAIIMGDSGAGKSESLEAFRSLSEEYISEMTIIFDDMGYLKLNDEGKAVGYGTEIGAFVRLDDLDQGYAFKEIDRSIFMNPDKTNARLVVPVATYEEITKGYPIDIFLYANNYEDVADGKESIELFKDAESALKVFRDGARMAKGTTTEKGLVKSYFANPFGPVQRKNETEVLLQKYFASFFENELSVGQIRTCLGIPGKEKVGPREAALKLFELIKSV
ncbi:MAG: phosphoenolpyruvate carboxykinase [Bacillota bacterium]|nr:phosphoenolpyruvate carboxykinase [Bacillota bacterium]